MGVEQISSRSWVTLLRNNPVHGFLPQTAPKKFFERHPLPQVLGFKRLQSLCAGNIHTAALEMPSVECRVAYPTRAARVQCIHARLMRL